MRAQYAALSEEQKQAIRARQKAYRDNPANKKKLARTAKRWRMNRSPEQIKKDLKAQNERMTRRYWALTPEQRKLHNQKRYKDRLVLEEINWKCEGGCGLNTRHPTGLCTMCRITKCRKCAKPLEQTFIGQRVHEKCAPKGDLGFRVVV